MYEIAKGSGTGEDYRAARFVLKAMSDDLTRPHLCVLHVEELDSGSRLVCTDGRRLHVACIDATIPSGDYSPEVTKQTVYLREAEHGLAFPDWKKVVPDTVRKRGTITLAGASFGRSSVQCSGLSIAFYTVIKKTGELVNLRYLDDLGKTDWEVFAQGEKHKALLFRHDEKGKESFAVIMPIDAAA